LGDDEGVVKDVDRLNIVAITSASESKRTEHNSTDPAKHDVGQCYCSLAPIGNAIWSALQSEGTEAEYWVPFMYVWAHAPLLPIEIYGSVALSYSVSYCERWEVHE
jgi:hypothetical protein